jgi:hypothetical protein
MSSMSTETSVFRIPASSRIDRDFVRTKTHPSGMICHINRAPGFAPSAFLTAAGTVVRPLESILDSATSLPLSGSYNQHKTFLALYQPTPLN